MASRNSERATTKQDKDLCRSENALVPSVVPTRLHQFADIDPAAYTDPGLIQVVTAWSHLPKVVKAGIVALVKAAGESDP